MQGIVRGRVLWHRMRFVERSSGCPHAIDWLYVRQTFNIFLKKVNNTLTLSMKLWRRIRCRFWTPVDIRIVRGAGTSAICWPASQSFLGVLVYVQLHNTLTYGYFTTMATLRNFGLEFHSAWVSHWTNIWPPRTELSRYSWRQRDHMVDAKKFRLQQMESVWYMAVSPPWLRW